MNLKSRPNSYQKPVGSLRDRLNAVGVQTFHFALYPENAAMLEYNTQENSKAHGTRFTSQEVWQKGSSQSILDEFLDRVHQEDKGRLSEYIQVHLESSMNGQVGTEPTPFSSERFRAKEAGQEYRWYELRSHLVLEVNLQIVICEGCFLDITDLVEREQELAQEVSERRCTQQYLEETLRTLKITQSELIASSKLKALGEMTSSVAHDFGNLLNPLLFYGQSLQNQLKKMKELTVNPSEMSPFERFKGNLNTLIDLSQANLNKMDLAILDSLSMIKRLRDSYHPAQDMNIDLNHSGNRIQVAASKLVQSAWFLARSRWRGQAEDLPLLEVSGDDFELSLSNESELRQALINLMCNALDAICEKPQCSLHISVILSIDEEYFTISILDQGIGMDTETLDLAQQSFYSSKGENGSGLGLLSVQQTMQKLGGYITILSEFNEWTKVILALPKPNSVSKSID